MTRIMDLPLIDHLRDATRSTHGRLDASIMAAQAFATLAGYARFVAMQWAFHREIDALYDDPALTRLLPGLADRRRLAVIASDLMDLGIPLPSVTSTPRFPAAQPVDIPTAVGWLYVAEGSNLGAALLRKEAAKLGLSDTHGARHLAPAEDGPAAHWRAFVIALNSIPLTDTETERAAAGAQASFAHVQALVDDWKA